MSRSSMNCRICGDVARGFNFSVTTCMSCKSFFRRNAYRPKSLTKCEFKNDCSITKRTRSYCSACRLEKCFAEGMDPLLIRCVAKYPRDSKKAPKPNVIQENRLQLAMPSTLDLLQNDRSTLTSSQWNLISNIIHLYDEQHSIVRIKSLIDRMCSLPPKSRSKVSNTSNILNQAFGSVQPFINRSLHLHALPIDTRRTLIKHNMNIAGSLNGLFIFREVNLPNSSALKNALTALYGDDMMRICVRNAQECDLNGHLIKMLIFILFFSSNCSIVTYDDQEDMRIMSSLIYSIEIQNAYVTTFWKYLVYLYGFKEAIVRFSSMVKRVLNLLYVAELISNSGRHNQTFDVIVTQTERSLVIGN